MALGFLIVDTRVLIGEAVRALVLCLVEGVDHSDHPELVGSEYYR